MGHSPVEAATAQVLRRLIAAAGRSTASVGRDAGFSGSYLSTLLRGRQDLKVLHIERVIEVLNVSPARFFGEVAAALSGSRAERSDEVRERGQPYGAPDLDYIDRRAREEGARDLQELVREIVREELGDRGHRGA